MDGDNNYEDVVQKYNIKNCIIKCHASILRDHSTSFTKLVYKQTKRNEPTRYPYPSRPYYVLMT